MNKTQWLIVMVLVVATFLGIKKLIESQGLVALFAGIFLIVMAWFVARLLSWARAEA